jgi:hypothetical protein
MASIKNGSSKLGELRGMVNLGQERYNPALQGALQLKRLFLDNRK